MGSQLVNELRESLIRCVKQRFATGGSVREGEPQLLWWPLRTQTLDKLCAERPRLADFRVQPLSLKNGDMQLGAWLGWQGYECLEGPLADICEAFGFKLEDFLRAPLGPDCVCTPVTPCLSHELRMRISEGKG